MSKKLKTGSSTYPGYTTEKRVGKIQQFTLKKNGLRVLFVHKPDTGVVTSSIVYKVGSRDERFEETGLAHMLEHMLFKPTTQDKKRRQEAEAMVFERETGVVLNANTWRDRTQYFFKYPTEHFERAIKIESERMRNVVLEDKSFKPEQGNVLSEFDMYNGDPHFALAVDMSRAAFMHHPYGHEVIGWRRDIENYTVEKLQSFYDTYYWPNNATFVIAGDISLKEVLATIKKYFNGIPATKTLPRHNIVESKQEGLRTIAINRDTPTNIVAVGFKHEGFPSKDWMTTSILGTILTDGKDSVLHKLLVEPGLASKISTMIEPSSEPNLGILFITLSETGKKKDILKMVREAIAKLDAQTIKPYLKKTIAGAATSEAFERASSYGLVCEMVEYESANAIDDFWKSEKLLASVTAKDIVSMAETLFAEENLTIGTLNYKLQS